jgi:hypothetical protein
MILHFENQGIGLVFQSDPGFLDTSVTADVAQCFLQDAIDLNSSGGIDGEGRAGFW